MADVERERVTALWREAAGALETPPRDRDELREILNRLHGEGGHGWIERAAERLTIITDRQEAECGRLREQLDAARGHFDEIEAFANERRWQSHESLLAIKATVQRARAALEVEGEQEKPT